MRSVIFNRLILGDPSSEQEDKRNTGIDNKDSEQSRQRWVNVCTEIENSSTAYDLPAWHIKLRWTTTSWTLMVGALIVSEWSL